MFLERRGKEKDTIFKDSISGNIFKGIVVIYTIFNFILNILLYIFLYLFTDFFPRGQISNTNAKISRGQNIYFVS